MKKNGWSIQEMLVLCFIIAFALFIAVAIFNETMKPLLKDDKIIDNAVYPIMEENLKIAAMEYVDDSLYNPNGVVITSTELVREGYIAILDDPNSAEECVGYVTYDYGFYKAYLSCGSNYTTSGYNSSKSK